MKRINLLPKLKQRELSYERVFYGVKVAVALGAAIMLVGVLVQLGVWSYLNRKIKASDVQIAELKAVANKSENAVVKQQIQQANAQIIDFGNLSAKTPQWSKVMNAFVKNVPQGVMITTFDADTAKKQIDIAGFSPTRDLVIDLYNNINSDKEHFKNINYPLENVTQPTNVRFIFTFNIADGLLVEGESAPEVAVPAADPAKEVAP